MISDPLIREADRCVKCGLCLPHCPTYLKLANEADSPRGRIALIQAWAADEIDLSASLQGHLDRCLGCRACERACPSGVGFGHLMDGARARIQQQAGKPASGLSPWLLHRLSDRNWLKRLAPLLPLLRKSHLIRLGSKITVGKLQRLLTVAQLLPDKIAAPGLFPADHPTGKSLQLFIGCVSSQADQPALQATTELLQRLGYAVEVPTRQVCCGALQRHNGHPQWADELCDINRKLTRNSRAEALITLASACHLELKEHMDSAVPVHNIVDFLLNTELPAPLEFNPLAARVAVHIPCSARDDRTAGLLKKIPQLEVLELSHNHICCGAAGSYLLTQTELSASLGRDKITPLESAQADILVTTNTGCALQFRLQIEQARLGIEVLHPVELINRQLKSIAFQA